MDYLQMHHPALDNRTITVAECGVRIHEAAGWVKGPGDDASPPAPAAAATTSEAATAPGSDGGTAATTDTGNASGSDTEEEGTP